MLHPADSGCGADTASLREQNDALHVTTERLLSTNTDLAAKVNRQTAQITALEQQLAHMPAGAPSAAADSQTAGEAFPDSSHCS